VEYCSLAITSAELLWLWYLLQELHTPLPNTLTLWCDNIGATYLPILPLTSMHIVILIGPEMPMIDVPQLDFIYFWDLTSFLGVLKSKSWFLILVPKQSTVILLLLVLSCFGYVTCFKNFTHLFLIHPTLWCDNIGATYLTSPLT
jgi:hypothetical protein